MQDNFDKLFDELITSGAVELSAMDENGQPLYSYTEKMFDVFPAIAAAMMNAFQSDLMQLWELGFLDMDVTDQNPTVRLTDKAKDDGLIADLPNDLRNTLITIKNAMLS